MLTTVAMTKEDLNKADVEVSLEKLKQIRHDKLLVDTLHFFNKIKTLLDLLV